MKKFTVLLGAAVVALSSVSAHAADVYVVKFRADDCQTCAVMESQLSSAMAMVSSAKVEEITMDSTNALKWEVSAHTAFDNNVVPQFNKWIGKTGFAAIIDAKTQRTLGCVTSSHDVYKMANFIKKSVRLPHDQAVANRSGQFQCPPTQNVDLGN